VPSWDALGQDPMHRGRHHSQPDPLYTVVGSSVAALARYAAKRGVDATASLSVQGLSLDMLDDPDKRVSQIVYNRLFDEFAQSCTDPDFGLHFAQEGSLDGFNVVGYLVQRSATLGEAFQRVERYSRIVHDAGRVEVENTVAGLQVFPGCRGLLHEYPRQVAEYAVASVVVIARTVTGRHLIPRRTAFRHPQPSSIAEHHKLFACQLLFSQPETCVVFDSQAADEVIRQTEPGLVSLLEVLARGLLEKLGEGDDLITRVQSVIARYLEEGQPRIETVARALGMSSRTLQRELLQSETTFQQILDSVRRRCAERLLEGSQVSLHEVAYLLGFSEPSNFHRAFRRWYGVTPAEYRERLLIGK
jgi:AraC-like DNA-binding protein